MREQERTISTGDGADLSSTQAVLITSVKELSR